MISDIFPFFFFFSSHQKARAKPGDFPAALISSPPADGLLKLLSHLCLLSWRSRVFLSFVTPSSLAVMAAGCTRGAGRRLAAAPPRSAPLHYHHIGVVRVSESISYIYRNLHCVTPPHSPKRVAARLLIALALIQLRRLPKTRKPPVPDPCDDGL